MRIQQLPPEVITKIAAGEVIERPASVVKELLENSVDAGSNRIDVEIEQGGIDMIQVVDDGGGIISDDLHLAFSTHATSKLTNADDLFRIGTLGFRGEALASIGGVAHVTIQSRAAGQDCGAEITCQGGDISPVHKWNGSPGTRVQVRHLFYNTPVRRKFLRTPSTEMGHLCEIFTRLVLAHSTLHLTLRHNGKHVYEVPASAGLLDRLGLFFGADLRDRLFSITTREGPVVLRGFVADPAYERGNAKMQYFFVNGRWVRDRSLAHALQEAYRGLLMTGRYPVAFLFLDLPPDQVDVNVHPTKAEVRFRDSQTMHHLVFHAIRERLQRENLTPQMRPPGFGAAPGSGITPGPSPFDRFKANPPAASPPSQMLDQPAFLHSSAISFQPPPDLPSMPGSKPIPPQSELPVTPSGKAIQLYDSYLVLETPEGMLVIDQHALHERILFEQLKRRINDGRLETQRLLIPEPIELSADQAARTLEHHDALAELGLEVEDFGGGTVLLTAYPAILGNRPPEKILRAVVDHLMSRERMPSREHLLNDLLSLMACHAAVRAGDRLTPEEIAALLEQRDLANDAHHCPHGRPTSLLFSRQELDRQFRRT